MILSTFQVVNDKRRRYIYIQILWHPRLSVFAAEKWPCAAHAEGECPCCYSGVSELPHQRQSTQSRIPCRTAHAAESLQIPHLRRPCRDESQRVLEDVEQRRLQNDHQHAGCRLVKAYAERIGDFTHPAHDQPKVVAEMDIAQTVFCSCSNETAVENAIFGASGSQIDQPRNNRESSSGYFICSLAVIKTEEKALGFEMTTLRTYAYKHDKARVLDAIDTLALRRDAEHAQLDKRKREEATLSMNMGGGSRVEEDCESAAQ
jgi:hypothetical protein